MNLKTYLEENNIPTSEFAKRLGITKAMVHRYITIGEDGKRTIPKFDLMMKILTSHIPLAMGMGMDWLKHLVAP